MTLSNNTTEIIDSGFGWIALIGSIPGILGNSCILRVFYDERHLLSRKIFILIAITDIVISMDSAIPFGLSRVFDRKPVLHGNPIFCNVSGVIFNVACRLSIFLISVLSFTRCLVIMNPMRVVRVDVTMWCIGGYTLLTILTSCTPYFHYLVQKYQGHHPLPPLYLYIEVYSSCNWFLDFVVAPGSWMYLSLEYLLLFFPFFFPSVIVVTSCVICFLALYRKVRSEETRSSGMVALYQPRIHIEDGASKVRRRAKLKATTTILVMTAAFVMLNIPHWILLLLFFIEQHFKVQIVDYHSERIVLLYIFCTNVSQYLNAAINPIIYITRVTEAQQSLRGAFLRLYAWFRWSPAQREVELQLEPTTMVGHLTKSVGQPRTL